MIQDATNYKKCFDCKYYRAEDDDTSEFCKKYRCIANGMDVGCEDWTDGEEEDGN